jgi:hypothetical protein
MKEKRGMSKNTSDNNTGNKFIIRAEGEREHRATYSKDRDHPGKWLVRVVGPRATKFVGASIPVTRGDGSESEETLVDAITSGIDDGLVIAADKGKTWCLYRIKEKPKAERPAVEF